jgi:hypothetical protein
MSRFAKITALVVIISCWGQAQIKRNSKTPARANLSSWRVFAPLGMRFRIEVPSKPNRIDNLYGDKDPNGYKSIDVYGVSQTAPVVREYQIIVLVPSDGMRKENRAGNQLGGLEFTIGGDNAEPTSELSVTVNGFKGKEFIYDLRDEPLGHRKGRIIDARTRIYVLIYATGDASDLNSSSAARFFGSFKTI